MASSIDPGSDTHGKPAETVTAIPCDILELDPEERKVLKQQACDHKTAGNELFKAKEFEDAIRRYEEALAICPEDENEDRAVFYSNIAACHMQLKEYEKAVEQCTQALKCNQNYVRALSRRAKANECIGSWSSLSDALRDYRAVLKLSPGDEQAQKAVNILPKRIEEQQEKEKAEMIGKLKNLGNSFLGNFGLSLDNFAMDRDPVTGGYSVNMTK
ncbi:uncharacterized protein SPPG_05375 [Spizellomyces punctatus DAOM BR117]|uniref:Uncharacterized protein n=1 Tax=Spizellomyces punctatus (strain DAOM BR117) TaxID=645134 RepID=A0A0L0HDM9_SPIPD|nr:uncharacterized protein SPPG_05375 [Spizellomyces punctatus DAOM BR117]KNC99116.1 hypothetical protein SPPG_05375 [Spizellomyces punctatus DAOM BR117]|eukprot:XP_016607156.1 hypothetical protein SPPG_05375 [Spizellomyces punctatus DAOM BR117]